MSKSVIFSISDIIYIQSLKREVKIAAGMSLVPQYADEKPEQGYQILIRLPDGELRRCDRTAWQQWRR